MNENKRCSAGAVAYFALWGYYLGARNTQLPCGQLLLFQQNAYQYIPTSSLCQAFFTKINKNNQNNYLILQTLSRKSFQKRCRFHTVISRKKPVAFCDKTFKKLIFSLIFILPMFILQAKPTNTMAENRSIIQKASEAFD